MSGTADYLLDVSVVFSGLAPDEFNRAAPEMREVEWAARDAMRAELERLGYKVERTANAIRRVDLP